MERAYLASDGSGHDYLIPYFLTDHFSLSLYLLEQGDEGYDDEAFDEEFGDYRVEGDYEIFAKF